MTKEFFLEKHNLSEKDYRNLKRYEEVRQLGKYNMLEYLDFMISHNANGNKKLASFIQKEKNYDDFLESLKRENKRKRAS